MEIWKCWFSQRGGNRSTWGKTSLNKERTNNKLNPLMVSLLGPSNILKCKASGLFLALHLQLTWKKTQIFCKRHRSKPICESKLSWANWSFWPDLNFCYINVWFSGYCRPTSEAQDSKVWSLWGRYEIRVSWTQCFSVSSSNFEPWVHSINEWISNPLKECPIDVWSFEPHVALD